MNTPDRPESKNDLNAVFEKIQEIAAKSVNGNYIYRGEPKCYQKPPYCGKISSSLWRECKKEMGEAVFNVEYIQKGLLNDAKLHIEDLSQAFRASLPVFPGVDEEDTDEISDFETLTEIQHYGGKTNLIDFTTDYLIALFFACDGHNDKDGRVILQKTEDITNMIKAPLNPRHRVITQKSVFVCPPKGFIEPHEVEIVTIPSNLKQPMLNHLQKYHGISTETIYNDLHGFIKHQSIHQKAYIEFYIGWSHLQQHNYNLAIENLNLAIEQNPDFPLAYYCRGLAFYKIGEYSHAIQEFSFLIERSPQFTMAHHVRGVTYLHLEEWDTARADLMEARNRKVDIIKVFRNEHESVGSFETEYEVKLPEDIASMLMPEQDTHEINGIHDRTTSLQY